MEWFLWPEEDDSAEGPVVPASVIDGIDDIEGGRTVDGEDLDETLGL